MTIPDAQIKAGQKIVISSGAYSDYSVIEVVEALRDFGLQQLYQEYFTENPKQREPYGFGTEDFILWVVLHGYVRTVEVDWVELHLEDYGNSEEAWFSAKWL